MEQRVTIRDIAEKAGTSVTSVHRALYGGKGISDKLRKKILMEVERSNYQMDEAASTLRRGKLYITILLPKAEKQERFFYRGLWEGIYRGAEELKRNKVNVTFVEATCGAGHMDEALEKLYDETDESLNGLVTICDDEKSRGWLKRFMGRGTKVVLVDRGIEIENLCGCLEVSVRDMARLAVRMMQLLMENKCEDIIVLINGLEKRISYRIYADAVYEKLKAIHPKAQLIVLDGYDVENSQKELKKILNEKKVSGIIAGCARATYWACELIQELDLAKKPYLVGTDVFEELAPYFENDILDAVISQSHREHGEQALRMLYESLVSPNNRKNESQEIVLPVNLVLKENYNYYL